MEITSSAQLKEKIALLETEAAIKKTILTAQFHETYESLKPVNLIKGAFSKLTTPGQIGGNAIDAGIGLGAGILSKKILIGKSTNIFKRLLGSVIKVAVASVVAKNADGIKSKGFELLKKVLK